MFESGWIADATDRARNLESTVPHADPATPATAPRSRP